jgi:hypothetical protein
MIFHFSYIVFHFTYIVFHFTYIVFHFTYTDRRSWGLNPMGPPHELGMNFVDLGCFSGNDRNAKSL